MGKAKPNYLLEAVVNILTGLPKGKVLDLGCGSGDYSKRLSELGFDVTASDMDSGRFQYHSSIPFKISNLNDALPFPANTFDYALFLEVIEHIYNPLFVVEQISNIIKPNGLLILSTPNILNIGSRIRFFFEGNFDFFREPILDYHKIFPQALQNMHVVAWRYQELEYLLFKNNLRVEKTHTDLIKPQLRFLSFMLKPLIAMQCWKKERRALKKGGVDFRRINRILLSDELFLGRHLILQARKT